MPLDIALGFLGAAVQAALAPEDLTMRLLVLGAVFALLPDADFLVSAVRKGSVYKVDHTHRDLLHHPLPYLAFGGVIVWWLAPQYLWLFLAMSLAHFVHDSIGAGWGVMWLSPFSRRHGKLFTDRKTNAVGWHPPLLWTEREREALIKERHDPDWLRHTYARPTRTAILEYAALAAMLLAALLLTRVL